MGVLQALEAIPDPDRVNIIKANPDLTTAVARGIARAASATKGKKKKLGNSRDTAGWIRGALAFAVKALDEYGHPKPLDAVDAAVLRAELPDPEQSMAKLRRGGEALISVAVAVKDTLESHPVPPQPMFENATLEAVE